MKLVSVILPTFNRATLVADAVQSVLQQTMPSIELIVVDDGSTDNTQDVLVPFLEDARVRYVKQNNAGVASARNAGLALAKGDFVAFVDSDDIWAKDKLQIQLAIFDLLPSVALVFSDFSAVRGAGHCELSHIRSYFSVFNDYDLSYESVFSGFAEVTTTSRTDRLAAYFGNVYQTMLFGNMILTSTSICRTDVFRSVGDFDARYSTLEDYDLFLRITKAFDVAYVDSSLVTYRYSANQLSGEGHFETLCHNLMSIFEQNLYGMDSAFRLANKRRIAQHSGMIQGQLGYYYFSHDQSSKAVGHYWKSVRAYPLNTRSLRYLLLCFLPQRLATFLRYLKSRGRSVHAGR